MKPIVNLRVLDGLRVKRTGFLSFLMDTRLCVRVQVAVKMLVSDCYVTRLESKKKRRDDHTTDPKASGVKNKVE